MQEQEKEIISNEEMTDTHNLEENMTAEQLKSESETAENTTLALEAEVASWKDKYMRLFAEFDNYKKRTSKEISDTIKTAGKDVIISMLDVMDDGERAAKLIESATNLQAVKEGLNLIMNKLNAVMLAKGLKAFDSIGEDFDVEKHEAITEITAPGPEMEGKVLDQIQKGYYLNDKLIRHAKVVVGKASN